MKNKSPKQMTLTEYRIATKECLKDTYGITLNDLNITDKTLQEAKDGGQTPKELVDWYGNKYSLTKATEMTMPAAMRVMRSMGMKCILVKTPQ